MKILIPDRSPATKHFCYKPREDVSVMIDSLHSISEYNYSVTKRERRRTKNVGNRPHTSDQNDINFWLDKKIECMGDGYNPSASSQATLERLLLGAWSPYFINQKSPEGNFLAALTGVLLNVVSNVEQSSCIKQTFVVLPETFTLVLADFKRCFAALPIFIMSGRASELESITK